MKTTPTVMLYSLFSLFSIRAILAQPDIETQIDSLLVQMTTEEKIAQMMMVREDFVEPADISTMGYGAILVLPTPSARPDATDAEGWAERYDARVQASLDSRLGIPLLVGVDAVHGHALAAGATVFPHNVGLGAIQTNTGLEAMGAAVADEVRATGCNWILGPAVSVARDIRWGRTYEGWGEHPETQVGKVGAFIEGVQEGGKRPVIATAKHFVGDGATLWGTSPKGRNNIDQGDAAISEDTLRELHLPPYLEAIEAGVGSIMVGYHQWNGVEAHHSHYLLTTLLKGELGFDGFIVSDATGFYEAGQDFSERSLSAANSGIDMFMLTNSDLWDQFHAIMMAHHADGNLEMSRIDDAVRRILRVKLRQGLFDFPLSDRQLTDSGAFGAEAHRNVARQLVADSLVLLRNHDDLLPLAMDLRIGVMGTAADDVGYQCGGWTYQWAGVTGSESEVLGGVSVLEGLQAVVEPAGGDVTMAGTISELPGNLDTVVYVIGERPYAEWFGDDASPSIRHGDLATISRIRASGTPVVVVVLSARPLLAGRTPLSWDALVFAGLPGTEGGTGIADGLFGQTPFTGALSHSWPESKDDFPLNFRTSVYEPVFPYGYGLRTQLASLPGSLPVAHAGEAYGFSLQPSEETFTSFSVAAGSLPEGLTLASNGQLSGQSEEPGLYPVEVEAMDTSGDSLSQTYLLAVLPAESFAVWQAGIPWQQATAGHWDDPDGDGLGNYLEYLAGTDPLEASDVPAHAVTLAKAGTRAEAGFSLQLRHPEMAGLFSLEFSRDMASWLPLEMEASGNGDNPVTLEASVRMETDDSPFFIRLEPPAEVSNE